MVSDLSIERQYSTLQSFQGAGEFLAENELLVKLAEAGLNVSAIGGSAKTVLWSGEKAAVGVAGVGADVNLSLSSVFNDGVQELFGIQSRLRRKHGLER